MPGGYYIPPRHQVSTGSQGDAPRFSQIAGLFWPQGDPVRLRHAAQAWLDMERALKNVADGSKGAANRVQSTNHGPAIDAFGQYWSKWDGGSGYLELTQQACGQMADALERYASAIEQAQQRVEEIAAVAATVVAVGLVLTVVTVGISDAVADTAAAGLVAAAAEVGIELSATVANIAGTILAGAAIGAVEGLAIDTAIQIERIDVFHDQKSLIGASCGSPRCSEQPKAAWVPELQARPGAWAPGWCLHSKKRRRRRRGR